MRTLAVLSLAAGIGLEAALSSIVDAILLRPLPVARPREIMRLFTASEGQPYGFVSYPDFEDFRKTKPMVAECLMPVAVGEPAQMKLALAVTPDYFQVLGVAARFGRTFTKEDQAVVVLAHGSANDLGKSLRVGPKLYTIIGIAPENFGLDRFLHADFYMPIRSYGDGKILEDRSRRFLTVHLRGLGAAAEIASIAERLERDHPETNRGQRAVVLDELTARLRTDKMMTSLAGLLGVLAALIFVIGCANACGALLIRREARAKVTAIKIALGASPMRLLGESLRESSGVSFAGCAFALPFAWVVTEALRRSIVLPTDFSISIAAHIDGRVIALACASAAAATLLCLVRIKAHNAIAMVEIALATALAAASGSLWAALNAVKNFDLGYRTDQISVMTFDPAQSGYDEMRTRAFFHELTERVRSLPGVRGVAPAQSVPLGMTGAQRQIRIGDQEEMTVWMNIVTPEYFEFMHMALVGGRGFDDRDGAIVNQELAKRIGVGEKMRVGGKLIEVIGVVKTAKYMRWDEAPRPFFYLPYEQNYASRMTLHVESDADIFGATRSLAREIPASDVRTLHEYFDNGAMFDVKIALRIAGVTGGGGLLLALAGLYGVISSAVARRRREIAIRIALGARHVSVFAMIVRQGMTIAILGVAMGLVAARLGSRLLRGLVPGSGDSSLGASAAAAGLMIGASLIACAVPAIKALRVDPAACCGRLISLHHQRRTLAAHHGGCEAHPGSVRRGSARRKANEVSRASPGTPQRTLRRRGPTLVWNPPVPGEFPREHRPRHPGPRPAPYR
jgi:putative ABC transport system permease protein